MLAGLVGRNVKVNGRRTSMRLEPSMWDALNDIARREGMRLDALVSRIETQCVERFGACPNLSSGVRVFVANYYRVAATEEGHRSAGHGYGDPVPGTALDTPPAPLDHGDRPGDRPALHHIDHLSA